MNRIFSSVKVWRQSFGQHLSKISVLYIEQVHLNTWLVEPAGRNNGSTTSEMKYGPLQPYLSSPLLLESWKLERKPSREMKCHSEQPWTIKFVQTFLFCSFTKVCKTLVVLESEFEGLHENVTVSQQIQQFLNFPGYGIWKRDKMLNSKCCSCWSWKYCW